MHMNRMTIISNILQDSGSIAMYLPIHNIIEDFLPYDIHYEHNIPYHTYHILLLLHSEKFFGLTSLPSFLEKFPGYQLHCLS